MYTVYRTVLNRSEIHSEHLLVCLLFIKKYSWASVMFETFYFIYYGPYVKICSSGSASFSNSNEDIGVSYTGTVTFDMTLSFSLPGPCGFMEEVDDYILKNSEDVELVHCWTDTSCNIFPTSSDQWWTVWNNDNIMYILHQAQRRDKGSYTAQVEGTDPSGSGIHEICKTVNVEGKLHV